MAVDGEEVEKEEEDEAEVAGGAVKDAMNSVTGVRIRRRGMGVVTAREQRIKARKGPLVGSHRKPDHTKKIYLLGNKKLMKEK